MSMRLEGKNAVVVGAGQTPGETLGNGRAVAVRFAQEGAHVVCVDRDAGRAHQLHPRATVDGTQPGLGGLAVAPQQASATCTRLRW